MAFLRYLYVGHFKRQDDRVALDVAAVGISMMPAVERHLNPTTVRTIADIWTCDHGVPLGVTLEHAVGCDARFLAFNRDNMYDCCFDVVAGLVSAEGCLLVDAATGVFVELRDLIGMPAGDSAPDD